MVGEVRWARWSVGDVVDGVEMGELGVLKRACGRMCGDF